MTQSKKKNSNETNVIFQRDLTLRAPIETIVSLHYQPAPPPSHYQNIPYQPKTTVPIGYPESTPDTNY